MRVRLPVLVWRSVLGEMVRVLVVTSVSLLTVIAFAGAVKPLAEGQIGLGDALVLTLLLAVPMLQFALPFAAGFASTMSYHRMASDNEAVAAAAGGVSHRSIVAPAVVVGLVLAVGLGVLANDAIPAFLRRAERLVHRDIARVLVAPIERGLPIHLSEFGEDVDIYAEGVEADLRPPPGSGALEDVALFKVLLVVRRHEGGGAVDSYSAERADILLFADPDDPGTTAGQLVASGVTTNSREGVGWQRTFSTKRIRIPSQIDDDPKYLGFGAMKELRERPRRLGAVEERARRLIGLFASEEMIKAVREGLARRGEVTLRSSDRTLTVSAGGLDREDGGWRIVPGREGARVEVMLNESGLRSWAGRAVLRFPDEDERERTLRRDSGAPAMALSLEDVLTEEGRDSSGGVEHVEQGYSGLRPVGFDGTRWDTATAEELLEEASARSRAGTAFGREIVKAAARLDERVKDLDREIKSKIHERVAFSGACLVMVVTGAVVALRMRESLPLPVYLWSFFPALLAVVTISTGQRLTHDHGTVGLVVLWGGVAGLAVYTLMEYGRLRRH